MVSGEQDLGLSVVEAGHEYLEGLRASGARVIFAANNGEALIANIYVPTVSLPDLARKASPLPGDSEPEHGEDN